MRDDIVQDIRTLMAPCDPVQDNAENHPEHILVSKCNEIMASNQPYPRPRFPRQRMAWAAAATGFAVVVAAAFVAVQLRPRSAGSVATPVMLQYRLIGYSDSATSNSLPPGRSRLLKLAKVAAAQPPLAHPAGDQVGYVATWDWNMTTAVSGGTSASAIVPKTDQVWTTPSGTAVQIVKNGPAINLSDAQTPHNLLQAVDSGSSVMSQEFSTDDNFGLPVQTMTGSQSQIQRDVIRGFSYYFVPAERKFYTFELMKAIAGLNHQVISPSLESHLWTMLASRSDVSYMGLVRDRAGREGAAFCATIGGSGRERQVLIVSPQTGMLLGEEDLFLSNPGGLTIKHYPAVIGYTTYVTSQWVSKAPPVSH
jgi:hypothetical protein